MAGSNATPRARKVRSDGWTIDRINKFLEVLANTAHVSLSAKAAQKSRDAAYKLRARDPSFAAAWDAAIDHAMDDLFAVVLCRVRNGTEREIYYQGKPCGTTRTYSNGAAIRLLAMYRPALHQKLVEARRPIVEPPFAAADALLAQALRRRLQ